MSDPMMASDTSDVVPPAPPLEDPYVLVAIAAFGFAVLMIVWVRRRRRASGGG